MKRVEKKKSIELEFGNVSEFIRYINSNQNKPSQNGVLTRGEFDFFQTKSWGDFEDYLQEGNKDITSELKEHTKFYVDKFEQQIAMTSSYKFDVTGDFFDIGAVMIGEPEAWLQEIKIEDERFITLDIQGVYDHRTDLAMVRKNGAKVFAMATVLEQQGFAVKINMHYSTNNSGNYGTKYSTCINVKNYDGVLDFKKFGILLGVPFFRRGILRSLEIEYGVDTNVTFGAPQYGAVDGEIRLDNTADIDLLERKLKNEEV
jgi:hypothetical protein